MSDVHAVLREFIGEHEAGRTPDPSEFLERTDEGLDRRELAALIDAYLVRAPRRQWDAAAFRQSGAAPVAEGLGRSLAGAAGTWPALLPRLRARARLRRTELVDRLAAALGVSQRRKKVSAYYHEMEQGLLPAAGVSERVLEALGEIVGESAGALREAGTALGGGSGGAGERAIFARTTAAEQLAGPGADDALAGAPLADEGWDEVDELFRGG